MRTTPARRATQHAAHSGARSARDHDAASGFRPVRVRDPPNPPPGARYTATLKRAVRFAVIAAALFAVPAASAGVLLAVHGSASRFAALTGQQSQIHTTSMTY